MKELLKQLATYNVWAHQKLIDLILSLPAEKQLLEVPSSFNSLHNTLLHMWDAESMWWQRIKLQEHVIRPSEGFKGNCQDAANGLMHQSQQWQNWIAGASEMSIEHVIQYQTTKKELFKQPIFQIILQVFSHGSYHRGQLVNILRQLGIEKIPQTDFIVWSRKK